MTNLEPAIARLGLPLSTGEIEQEMGLSKGSIGPARQELIAAGLIVPLTGVHKRGGDDPVAAYRINLHPMPSPEQERAVERVARYHARHRIYAADRRKRTLFDRLNGHMFPRDELPEL